MSSEEIELSSLDSTIEYKEEKYTELRKAKEVEDKMIKFLLRILRKNKGIFESLVVMKGENDVVDYSTSKLKWKCKCGKEGLELSIGDLKSNSSHIFHPFYCMDCRKKEEKILNEIYHTKVSKNSSCKELGCKEKSTHQTRGGIYFCEHHRTVTSYPKKSLEKCFADENCKRRTLYSEVPSVKRYCGNHKRSCFTPTTTLQLLKLNRVLKTEKNKKLLKKFILLPKTYMPNKKLDKGELLTNPQVQQVLKFLSLKTLVFEDILGEADENGLFSPKKTLIKYLCVCQNVRLKLSVEEFLTENFQIIYCSDCYDSIVKNNNLPVIKRDKEILNFHKSVPLLMEDPYL
eukprot:TRINITY_DN8805_c0_g1_i1.p1 TRINITY_DN8805_c0_g1~~TRINITY_DN8805_c0_g1_i1.p1  ORF type:complete len:359 (-),score=81.54 TRINITY_DN8805_c0_g1_i1:54-1088(-)